MRKMTVFGIVLCVILCGCQFVPHEPISQVSTPQDSDTMESCNETTANIFTGYPIMFVDTMNYSDRAYVLCVYENGVFHTTEEYMYSRSNNSEYIAQDSAPVSSDFIDLSQEFKFQNTNGNTFTSSAYGILCSERIIDEFVEVHVALNDKIAEEGSWLLGTYSNIGVFPNSIDYRDDYLSVDLDSDGDMDIVRWTFSPADAEVFGDHHYWNISIEQNGKVYSLENRAHLPINKQSLSVFIADINTDGNYEIIVFTRQMSKFGEVRIFALSSEKYCEQYLYVIDPEP